MLLNATLPDLAADGFFLNNTKTPLFPKSSSIHLQPGDKLPNIQSNSSSRLKGRLPLQGAESVKGTRRVAAAVAGPVTVGAALAKVGAPASPLVSANDLFLGAGVLLCDDVGDWQVQRPSGVAGLCLQLSAALSCGETGDGQEGS